MSIGSSPIDAEDNGGRNAKVLCVSCKPNWSPSYSTAPPSPVTNHHQQHNNNNKKLFKHTTNTNSSNHYGTNSCHQSMLSSTNMNLT